MPFELSEKPIFQLETEAHGLLDARDLVRGIEHDFAKIRKRTSVTEEVIRLFASLTLYRKDDDSAEDPFADSKRITLDDARGLTKADLDEFSEAYVENSKWLQMRFQHVDFPKKAGEAPIEYFYRVLLHEEECRKKELQKVIGDFDRNFASSEMRRMQQAIEEVCKFPILKSPALFATQGIEECFRKMAQIESPTVNFMRQMQEQYKKMDDLSFGAFSAIQAEHTRVINEIQTLKFDLPKMNYFEQIKTQIMDVSSHISQALEPIKYAISSVAESAFMRNFQESIEKFKDLPDINVIYKNVGHVAIESASLRILQDVNTIFPFDRFVTFDLPRIFQDTIVVDGNSLSFEEVSTLLYDTIDDKQISEADSLVDALNNIARSISESKQSFPKQILIAFIAGLLVHIVITYGKLLSDKIAHTPSEQHQMNVKSRPIESSIGYGFITSNRLNVREMESTKANIIGTLNRGTVVKIVDKRPYWYLIEWRTESCTLKGWASIRHIQSFQ
jgi:hypothetical protein